MGGRDAMASAIHSAIYLPLAILCVGAVIGGGGGGGGRLGVHGARGVELGFRVLHSLLDRLGLGAHLSA